MSRTWNASTIDIIFAEDDLVFREIALPAITKVGIPEDKVKVSEHGEEALEQLQELQDGNPDHPIVMLLDMRMPTMDGQTCATRVKELKEAGRLKRCPYVVCCSAGVEQVSFAGEDGKDSIFHITMPKPFANKEVDLVLKHAKEWWMSASSQSAAPAGAPGTVGTWDLSQLTVIIGNREPICSMALSAALGLLDVEEDNVIECDSIEKTGDEVERLQVAGDCMPLLIFLEHTSWGPPIKAKTASAKRRSFVVLYTVDGAAPSDVFDASVKPHDQEALKELMSRFKDWWQRG